MNKKYIPKTREEAIALGEKRFFTGEPCNHGHVSTRSVHNNRCQECARITSPRRRANLEKLYRNYI